MFEACYELTQAGDDQTEPFKVTEVTKKTKVRRSVNGNGDTVFCRELN